MRDNDDKALRRQAERIHLQTSSSPTTPNSTINSTNSTEAAKAETANSETPTPTVNNTGTTTAVNNTTVDTVAPTTIAVDAPSEKVEDKTASANAPDADKESTKVVKMTDEEDEDEYRGVIGDKLWEDVDKDLGDILREAEPGAKSSDDEDSRYDRFRNSEKANNQLNKEKERAEGGKDVVTENATTNISPKKIESKSKAEKIEK